MNRYDIIQIIMDNLMIALVAVVVFAITLSAIYYVIYKKYLKGVKQLPVKTIVKGGLLGGYLLMVLGVTFFNRGGMHEKSINLAFFSSYREAWYRWDTLSWQSIYLNIFMFLPFGILLPFIHPRFQKIKWLVTVTLLFTLSIECLQFLTGRGIFDIDDLFNNFMGSIIGYGLSMSVISLYHKKIKGAIVALTPLFAVFVIIASMNVYYEAKAFGNLASTPSRTVDMKDVTVQSAVDFSDEVKSMPVYQAKQFTKKEADQFAERFFEQLQIAPQAIQDISYPDLAMYRAGDGGAYQLSIDFRSGMYDYLDFSSHDERMVLGEATESQLKKQLEEFNILIPEEATFDQTEAGHYVWMADFIDANEQMVEGKIEVAYYQDQTIKAIDHQMISYEPIQNQSLKSEKEAYEELLKGKFQFFERHLHDIQIHDVSIQYELDSKSYYQPVYVFNSTINGQDYPIVLSAF